MNTKRPAPMLCPPMLGDCYEIVICEGRHAAAVMRLVYHSAPCDTDAGENGNLSVQVSK